MQLRGWGPTRAARIVIILVVVQYLGLGQILAFAPAATTGFTNTVASQAMAALDAAVPLVIVIDASGRSSAALGEHDSRTTLPDRPPSLAGCRGRRPQPERRLRGALGLHQTGASVRMRRRRPAM